MIDRNHTLPITRQAQLLGISRGAVYYMPRSTSTADLALMRRIDELHLQYPFMGARQLRRQLQREGVEVGRRHIDAHPELAIWTTSWSIMACTPAANASVV